MNFGSILGDYLVAYEAHSWNELELHDRLQTQISNSTLGEIIEEYNKLTVMKLWYPPVVSIFHDELLSRAMDSTFMISTSYVNDNDYPVVQIQIGYEDSYYVLDSDDVPIRVSDLGRKSYSLLNDSFTDQEEKQVQRILLRHNVMVDLGSHREILKVYSQEDHIEQVTVSKLEPIFSVVAKIIEMDDYGLIRRALDGIRNVMEVIV